MQNNEKNNKKIGGEGPWHPPAPCILRHRKKTLFYIYGFAIIQVLLILQNGIKNSLILGVFSEKFLYKPEKKIHKKDDIK